MKNKIIFGTLPKHFPRQYAEIKKCANLLVQRIHAPGMKSIYLNSVVTTQLVSVNECNPINCQSSIHGT